jgi:KUP system potassium uptake protein
MQALLYSVIFYPVTTVPFSKLGTSKVSFMFSPIMIAWFVTNIMIGLYNIVKYYFGAFKAFNPYYISITFMNITNKDG